MTLTFEQTFEDVIAVGFFNRKRVSVTRKIIKLIPLLVPLALILFLLWLKFYYYYHDEGFELPARMMLICVLLIAYTICIRSKLFYSWWCKRVYYRRGFASWYGQRIITISESVLSVKTVNTETNYNWNSFSRFGETDTHFFLFTTRIQAVIIPKRIFLLSQEEHDIKSFIERKLAEQKH
jgi:hypothetical protein